MLGLCCKSGSLAMVLPMSILLILSLVAPAIAADVCAGPDAVVRLVENSDFSSAAIKGDLMVVTDIVGLSTWDVSDPAGPVRLGEWRTLRGRQFGWGTSVHLDGRGYAVILPNLEIFDVRDPASPQPVSTPSPTGRGSFWDGPRTGFAISGNIIVNRDPLEVLDFSNPLRPQWHEVNWNHTRDVKDVAFDGDRLFVLTRVNQIWIYDMSDPFNPRFERKIELSMYWRIGTMRVSPTRIVLSALATSSNHSLNVYVIDISTLNNPVFHDLTDVLHWEMIMRMELDGETLFANVYQGLQSRRLLAIDLSSPATPTIETFDESLSSAWDLQVTDSHVVVTTNPGITIFDRSPIPLLLAEVPAGGEAEEIAIGDGVAVVAMGHGGILTIDLLGGEPAVLAGLSFGTSWIHDVAVNGDEAWAIASDGMMFCIDISSPDAPTLLSSIETRYYAETIVVEGDIAVVLSGAWWFPLGCEIFDIGDPENPQLVSTFETDVRIFNGIGVELRYGLAYLAGGSSLVIADLSTPAEPERIGSIELYYGDYGNESMAVALVGDLAVVGGLDWNLGSSVVDISDPTDPQLVMRLPDHLTWEMSVAGTTVAIPTWNGTLELADFANPEDPTFTPVTRPLRDMDAGVLTETVWYIPTGPFLEIYTRSCEVPEASFSWTGSDRELHFHNTSTGFMPEVSWDFGDGTTADSHDISHLYENSGVYTVTLEIGNESGSDTHVETITVLAGSGIPGRRTTGRHSP